MPKTARPSLYFAYGSNLARQQFARRCPNAKPVSRCTLPGYRLVFDGVADIVPSTDDMVEGALYRITPTCERALDLYEGFPSLYVKAYFTVEMKVRGKRVVEDVMFYTMMTKHRRPPSAYYLETIRTGYDNWKIPFRTLNRAADDSAAVKRRA